MGFLTIKQKKARGLDKNGRFIAGRVSERKGKPYLQIREEKHPNWIGGTRATARRIAERYGFNLLKCSICGKKEKCVVHHVDENEHNNNLNNLRILCYGCHNQLHGAGMGTRFQKGHNVPLQVREKISMANKGKTAWNKGRKKQ